MPISKTYQIRLSNPDRGYMVCTIPPDFLRRIKATAGDPVQVYCDDDHPRRLILDFPTIPTKYQEVGQ